MGIGISFCNSECVNLTYELFCRLFSVRCTLPIYRLALFGIFKEFIYFCDAVLSIVLFC